MNEALNGIPLDNSVHLGSHNVYDGEVLKKFELLEALHPNITPEQAYDIIPDFCFFNVFKFNNRAKYGRDKKTGYRFCAF